jgi:hypothetical protein
MFTQLDNGCVSRIYILQPSYDPLLEYYTRLAGSPVDCKVKAPRASERPRPVDRVAPSTISGHGTWTRWFSGFRHESRSDRPLDDVRGRTPSSDTRLGKGEARDGVDPAEGQTQLTKDINACS